MYIGPIYFNNDWLINTQKVDKVKTQSLQHIFFFYFSFHKSHTSCSHIIIVLHVNMRQTEMSSCKSHVEENHFQSEFFEIISYFFNHSLISNQVNRLANLNLTAGRSRTCPDRRMWFMGP